MNPANSSVFSSNNINNNILNKSALWKNLVSRRVGNAVIFFPCFSTPGIFKWLWEMIINPWTLSKLLNFGDFFTVTGGWSNLVKPYHGVFCVICHLNTWYVSLAIKLILYLTFICYTWHLNTWNVFSCHIILLYLTSNYLLYCTWHLHICYTCHLNMFYTFHLNMFYTCQSSKYVLYLPSKYVLYMTYKYVLYMTYKYFFVILAICWIVKVRLSWLLET